MKKIQPLTIDVIHSIEDPSERIKAITRYHTWLKEVRIKDRRVHKNLCVRISMSRFRKRILYKKCIYINGTVWISYVCYVTLKGELTERMYYHIH